MNNNIIVYNNKSNIINLLNVNIYFDLKSNENSLQLQIKVVKGPRALTQNYKSK